MKRMSNRPRWLLLLFVFSLVVAACAGDTEGSTTTGAPAETTTTAAGATTTTEAAVDSAMTLTVDIKPDAVWSDGTPITAADFVCTWNAFLNTPGSISTAGWDQILSVAAGSSDKQVVVEFTTVYAPYQGLFNQILPAHMTTTRSESDIASCWSCVT